MENITLTLLRNGTTLPGLTFPQQRTIERACVCVYVCARACPQFFHLKETPEEKLTIPFP